MTPEPWPQTPSTQLEGYPMAGGSAPHLKTPVWPLCAASPTGQASTPCCPSSASGAHGAPTASKPQTAHAMCAQHRVTPQSPSPHGTANSPNIYSLSFPQNPSPPTSRKNSQSEFEHLVSFFIHKLRRSHQRPLCLMQKMQCPGCVFEAVGHLLWARPRQPLSVSQERRSWPWAVT